MIFVICACYVCLFQLDFDSCNKSLQLWEKFTMWFKVLKYLTRNSDKWNYQMTLIIASWPYNMKNDGNIKYPRTSSSIMTLTDLIIWSKPGACLTSRILAVNYKTSDCVLITGYHINVCDLEAKYIVDGLYIKDVCNADTQFFLEFQSIWDIANYVW